MYIAPRAILVALLGGILQLAPALPAAAEDAADERWNLFGQSTYIWHRKNEFAAAYTNLNGSPNSLLPERERSYTLSATAFVGVRLWSSGELYIAPELISELPPSALHGLGGSFQNGELEKNGTRRPTLYRSRLFLRQTWSFGGETLPLESAPMQLAGSVDSRRLVLTAGNLPIIDIFDRNAYAGDVRQQFMSMNFLTHAAFDFDADARGYTWGAALEYYHDDWAIRFGRFIGPRHPNQLQLNYSIMNYYGDNLEVEHSHKLNKQPGKIRVLFYRNVALMGRWDEAINTFLADPSKNAATCTSFNYGSANAGAPDLCWVRNRNSKSGLGINLEQAIGQDAGIFFRAMKSDGKTEVYSFTSTDSSVSFGTLVKGGRWGRAGDSLGVGFAKNWLSGAHVSYLNMGGIDGFIGDGRINYQPERAIELFYNFKVSRFFWLALDAQRIVNPAYNSDRGPVTFYGVRLHAEF